MALGEDPGFEPPRMPGHAAPGPGTRSSGDDPGVHRPDEIVVPDGAAQTSRLRPWLLLGGAVVVVLALIGVLTVLGPGRLVGPTSGAGSSVASSGPDTAVLEPPALPARFDTFTLQPETSPTAEPEPGDDLAVAAGTYTQNGQPSILLVAARPVDDMGQFLLSLGATDITATGVGTCAVYDGVPLCGVVRRGVGWAVSPLAGQAPADLVRIAESAADAT